MSVVSVFLTTQLLKVIESEFSSHEGEMQEFIIKEFQSFLEEGSKWVEDKLSKKE